MAGARLTRRIASGACLPACALVNALRPGIRILMYHRVREHAGHDQLSVTPGRFRRQMEILAGMRRVVSLRDAAAQLARGSDAAGVAITFDDGYRDNLEHALPVLRELGLPATIFVTTAFAAQTARHPRYPAADERLHLDWDEVRFLAAQPGIEIGSHTCSHPRLSRLADEQARDEIRRSRAELEAELRRPVDLFCYPSGDMGAREEALTRESGYVAAVTVHPGPNRPGQPLLALCRTEVTDQDDDAEFRMKLRGAFDPVHRLLHWRRMRGFARDARAG